MLLSLIYARLPKAHFISEWDSTGDASSMRFEMGARFGDSGGREVSLELCERSKDAQHEFVEGGFAQSLGRHDFPCDVVLPQFFKQGDEVPQIPRQPVEAMDHELLDAARPDNAQQSVQGSCQSSLRRQNALQRPRRLVSAAAGSASTPMQSN
jgi:hypothetical protein